MRVTALFSRSLFGDASRNEQSRRPLRTEHPRFYNAWGPVISCRVSATRYRLIGYASRHEAALLQDQHCLVRHTRSIHLTFLLVNLLWRSYSVACYASLHNFGFLETCKDNIRSARKKRRTVFWKHRDSLCSIDWDNLIQRYNH